MTQLVGSEIVTDDLEVMPEPVAAVSMDDIKEPEFEAVGDQVNLEDL